MGRNHARVLAGIKGVDLVAVVDPDAQAADAVAKTYGCQALRSIDLLEGVDAATVAVPPILHADIGCDLLESGVHCLVEKPLASNRADANRLIKTADAARVHLQVGHIERFNPAVRQLAEIVENEQVIVVNARRMSAVSGRVVGVDVVADLMVHDLDIVLYLMGSEVSDVVARGLDGPHGADHVTAMLTFSDGRMASLTASRVTQNHIRHLEVTTRDRFFTVDYPNQELLIYRQGRIAGLGGEAGDDGRYILDVGTERVFVRRLEPLVEELVHFVDVVRGKHRPEVDGRCALESLDLVWAIQAQLEDLGLGENPRRRLSTGCRGSRA